MGCSAGGLEVERAGAFRHLGRTQTHIRNDVILGGDAVSRTDTPLSEVGALDAEVAAPSSDLEGPGLDATVSGCPADMAPVGDACIDRFEAALEEQVDGVWTLASPYLTVGDRDVRAVVAPGEPPQAYLSGLEAEAACLRAGKRLCTSSEWLLACRGAAGRLYPYGDIYQPGACNDSYAGTHPVVDFFGTAEGIWDPAHMNDPGINQQPGTLAPAGGFANCVTPEGVFDLHGNLHEWVSDPDGVFRGGFYADASLNGEGCTYDTTAHTQTYHDYSTGFRCCRDVTR